MRPLPLLFLGDAPESHTGLAKIARDLAMQVSREPEFRVGYLGRGGVGSRRMPFSVYQIDTRLGEWGEGTLPRVWDDFAGAERGIIMTVWDVTRTAYLTRPEFWPADIQRDEFYDRRPFTLWGYFPVDAEGIGGRFNAFQRTAYGGYDRRLWYTRWCCGLAERSGISGKWMPHGLNLASWPVGDRLDARHRFLPTCTESALLIGCVATNQPRKDWGLVFGTAAKLKDALGEMHLWAHTDLEVRYWNLNELALDFGLRNDVTITTSLHLPELAAHYAACDVTIAPGLGEGFGYPIVESLACGTPVVHGNYGGGAELIYEPAWLVEPVTYRIDAGLWGDVRPVFTPDAFAEATLQAVGADRQRCRAMVEHLEWRLLWPSVWRKWFLRGLG